MERMLGEACNGVKRKKKKHKYSRTFSESEKLREGIISTGDQHLSRKYSTTIDQSTNGRFIIDHQVPLSFEKNLALFSLFVLDRDINAVMIRISLISLIFIASLSFVLYLVSIEALTIHDPDTQVISSIRAAMFSRLTYDQESNMADPACVFIKM